MQLIRHDREPADGHCEGLGKLFDAIFNPGVTVHRFRPVGSLHKRSKLKEADIQSIRELRVEGATLQGIAERFGVSFSNVYRILSGKTWRHVV